MIPRALCWIALSAGVAGAQIPGMFPWWDSPLVRDLKLTPEQHRHVRETVRQSRPRLLQQRAVLETAEGELADLLNEEQVDAAKAGEAIERVIAARSDLARTVSQMSLKLRLILTVEQWRLLQERQRRPPGIPPGGVPGNRPYVPPDRAAPVPPPEHHDL